MGTSARNECRVGGTWLLGMLLFVASAGSVACSTTASGLKARFAREQTCPADQVSVTDAGGAAYRVSGCGTETEYVCESFAGMGDSSQRCHERGLNPHEPMGNAPPQNATVSRPDLVGPK
jgi:hypothetical protein